MKSPVLLATAALAMSLPTGAPSATPPAPTALQAFGVCATKNYEGAELLATQPGSPEEAEVIAEYGSRSCSPPTSEAGILRGAVAEQLFKTDFGTIGGRPKRDLIEVFTVDMNELAALGTDAKRRIDYVAFGTCVAASDPDNASALLKTAAGSAEERQVMVTMVPKYAACVSEGDTFNLSRADLRSALAEGAYRLALSQSLNQEVIVTGTRDPSKSVQCKQIESPGTHLRKSVCMTEANWAARERENEFQAKEDQRHFREYQERLQTCITYSLGGDGSRPPCRMN
ncbi:hypothetical protein GCM10023264_05260 [Sphingomonas daechungensis]